MNTVNVNGRIVGVQLELDENSQQRMREKSEGEKKTSERSERGQPT